MALLGALMPYLRPDPMRGRLKATTKRRRDLRAQRVEVLQRRSKLRRVILDKNVRIPEDAVIGYDHANDTRYHHVTESGIVVVEGHRSSVEVASMQM